MTQKINYQSKALTGWQSDIDSNVLQPINRNIQERSFHRYQHSSNTLTRKHLKSQKNHLDANNEEILGLKFRDPLLQGERFVQTQKINNFSNLTLLKRKMKNIEKNYDRWDAISKENIQADTSAFFCERAKSSLNRTKSEQQSKKTLSNEKKNKSNKSRPVSCRKFTPKPLRQKKGNQALIECGKIQPIHNKTSKPNAAVLKFKKKKRDKELEGMQFSINQLEGTKMKNILQCLSRKNF